MQGGQGFIRNSYEVFRSVGFKFSGGKEKQGGVVIMRLDIVRHRGQAVFSPMLWAVNPMAGAVMLSEMDLPAELCRATGEEALQAAVAFLKSKGFVDER